LVQHKQLLPYKHAHSHTRAHAHTPPWRFQNSRNHHMFASVGGWLYEDLAGIGQTRSFEANYDPTSPDSVAFRHAVIFPRVTNHPNVSTASAFYESMSGRYSVDWEVISGPTGGVPCAADAPENSPLTLGCPGGGVITAVTFASFGNPSGSCATGFKKGTCDAPNSTSAVTSLCVGKSSCVVPVGNDFFGGDPCYVSNAPVILEPHGISRADTPHLTSTTYFFP